MQWEMITATLMTAAALTTGCGQATPGHSSAHAQPPTAILTADPQWIPDPGVVALVKTSSLNDCTQRSVEQQVDSYLAAPRWEAGADSRGRDFVNVSGIVTYGGKPATALFQFLIDQDKRGFKYHAFAINGVLQPAYVAGMTLREMCGSAMRSPLKIIKLPPAVTH